MTATALPLAGVQMVRLFATTNNCNDIPSWVEERKGDEGSKAVYVPVARKEPLFEERQVSVTEIISQIATLGLVPARAYWQARSGNNVRLGIVFEPKAEGQLTIEQIKSLEEFFKTGAWNVRVDRNDSIARVPVEHAVISCNGRGKKANDRKFSIIEGYPALA